MLVYALSRRRDAADRCWSLERQCCGQDTPACLRRAMKGYQVLEDALKGKEYLVNDTYSAADIAVSKPTMNIDVVICHPVDQHYLAAAASMCDEHGSAYDFNECRSGTAPATSQTCRFPVQRSSPTSCALTWWMSFESHCHPPPAPAHAVV